MESEELHSDSDEALKKAQLFVAISKDRLDKVKALLGSGVKTDIIDKNIRDNTPLHHAVEQGKKQIVAELLNPKWKTNIDLKNSDGKTPLDIAIKKNHQELVQLLLNHRTKVSAETMNNPLDTTEQRLETRQTTENSAPRLDSHERNISKRLTYERTDGACGIEGHQCEINLSILLLLKGIVDERITSFYLASNIKKADKFDDVVFKYEDRDGKSKIVFLQSKHKINEKGVNLDSLLSESGDFSLKKYFISYRKIRKLFLDKKDPDDPIFCGNFADCEFLIYTNGPFSYGPSKCVKEATNEIDLLQVSDSQARYYQFELNSDKRDKILKVLKNSSECRRLAKELAKAYSSGKGIDMQKEIFQSYHSALTKVIQIIGKLTGKLSDDFLNPENLCHDRFRTVFFEEAAKALKKPLNVIQQELKEREIILSNKFIESNCSGCPDLPSDEPIHESEVEDFLSKFKLYAFQPNEKVLETMINETAKDFYKIEQQDMESVFAEIEYKFKNWWKCQNYYLTKGNKFIETAARVSVQFDVIEPVASFTGRSQELADLHKILQRGGEAVLSQTASITGLGGVGKSELARKYLSDHKKDYDNNIIWINANNFITLADSFRRLANDKLGICTTNANGQEKDLQLVTEDVYRYFTKRHRKSIFVFDNAEKYKVVGDGQSAQGIDKYLPQFASNKPVVLITSRDQEWGKIQQLPIGVFTGEEAINYIENGLKGVVEVAENEAQKLAEELDHLPLALSQAVAYISVENQDSSKWSKDKFTVSNYLQQFKKHAADLMSKSSSEHCGRYSTTVLTTWKMTKSKIEAKKMRGGESAIEMLHIIAYLAPDKIPVDDIFATKFEDEELRHAAVELLDQYSMIRLESGNVNIHRLVQQVTRIELEELGLHDETIAHTVSIIVASFPYASDQMEECFKKRKILPHSEALLLHINDLSHSKPDNRMKIEIEYLLNLLIVMADGYEQFPERQKELLESALRITEDCYGPDHYEVAIPLGSLANVYSVLGDAQMQKQLCERSLAIKESYYGPDHFENAITLGNLGVAYITLGDVQKSIQFYERALAIKDNHYGPNHHKNAVILTNLGEAYRVLGEAQKGKEMLERALTMNENFYGPDHYQVSVTLVNLSNAYGDLGDVQKKKDLLERALRITENYNGPDHFTVTAILANLGDAYQKLGDTQKSIQLLERGLIIAENFYGSDHIDVAPIIANLGEAYMFFGDIQKAKHFIERALTINENYYGPDHFQVAVTLTNLGTANRALGDAEKAIQFFERALKINENFYGPDNFNVAVTLTNMGEAYRALGAERYAKQLLERCLTIFENHYGPDHFQVVPTLVNLGNVYGNLGDVQMKRQLLERALTIYENNYGPDYYEVANTLTNLGEALRALGNAQEARQKLERALTIQENYYGPDHFKLAATLANLGNAYGNLGEVQKKKLFLERALTIYENHFGPDHFELAPIVMDLGNAYGALGDAMEKKRWLERALTINQSYYGIDHVQVAIVLTNLGNAYGELGNAMSQKQLLERALPIFEANYGPDHCHVATTLVGLGNAYGDLGDTQKKKQLLERALIIKEAFYGPDHYELAITLTNLGNAYGDLGDVQQKKELLERALTITDHGFNQAEVAVILSDLSDAYGDLGHVEKKIQLLEKALTLKENYYGSDNFKLHVTLEKLSDAYKTLGDVKKSKKLQERAVVINEKHNGSNHFEVASMLVNYAESSGSLLNSNEMQKKLFEQALSILNEHYHANVDDREKILIRNLAFKVGCFDSIKALIEGGSDVLEKNSHDTFLHQAVTSNNSDIMKLILNEILQKDLDNFRQHVNAQDTEGDTPLMWAAECGRFNSAEVLLEYGADINAQNKKGETALHWATKGGFQEIVALLLTKNADINIKDNNGQTSFVLQEISNTIPTSRQ